MDNNKIQNPKTEVPKGIAMNDKDYMNAILSTEKCMVKNYAVAMTEASNEHLHQAYQNMFQTVDNLQRQIFEEMFRKGWYPLEKAEQQKVMQKANMFQTDFQDLTSSN